MLRPLNNKLVIVDKLKPRAIDQVLSTVATPRATWTQQFDWSIIRHCIDCKNPAAQWSKYDSRVRNEKKIDINKTNGVPNQYTEYLNLIFKKKTAKRAAPTSVFKEKW